MEATASQIHINRWDKKTQAFFASDPKCKECGGGFDHFSRTMICRECQKIKYRKTANAQEPERSRAYRKKHKEKIQAYQKNYYQANRDRISLQKKIKYRKKVGF